MGYVFECQFDLCPEFLFYLGKGPFAFLDGQAGVVGVGKHHGKEVTVAVCKRRTMGEGTPFDIVPFAGDGKVQSHVDTGVLFKKFGCFGKPGGNSHHLDGGLDSVFIAFHTGQVTGLERAHVVCSYN